MLLILSKRKPLLITEDISMHWKKMCWFAVWAMVLPQEVIHFFIYIYIQIPFKISVIAPNAVLFSVCSFPLFILYQWPISENHVHSASDLVFPMRSWYQMRLGGGGGGSTIHMQLDLITVWNMEKLELQILEYCIVYFWLCYVAESREGMLLKMILFACHLILYLVW